mmetsp:Transcript_10171/g.30326  ORF Transcript_10171/g.30326 Transcript_10171/m.30326 type:complete len:265 (-) Transcript_10171:1041-1835(-)
MVLLLAKGQPCASHAHEPPSSALRHGGTLRWSLEAQRPARLRPRSRHSCIVCPRPLRASPLGYSLAPHSSCTVSLPCPPSPSAGERDGSSSESPRSAPRSARDQGGLPMLPERGSSSSPSSAAASRRAPSRKAAQSHSCSPEPGRTPDRSADTPTTRCRTPCTTRSSVSKKRSASAGTAATSAIGSYMLKPRTRSQIETSSARSRPSPPRNVSQNQRLSHRTGSPARDGESAGAHARRHSRSIDVRCVSCSRRPICPPVAARSS